MDAAKLLKRCKRHPLVDVHLPTFQPVNLGRDAICRILPNREPFLFLDEITGIDLSAQAAVGVRKVDPRDPVFQGHFPGNPVYPGVLQLEMIAEMFCCLYYFVSKNTARADEFAPVQLVATRMRDCLLQRGVAPGDDVTVMTKVVELTELTYTGIGQLCVGKDICVAVIGDFYIVG